MKQWKTPLIGLFVIVCILMNYYGRMLALHFSLPLWLDAFGTVLCAYVAGPFAGAVVGLAGNLMQGIYPGVDAVYGLHVQPYMNVGRIDTRPGCLNGSTDMRPGKRRTENISWAA